MRSIKAQDITETDYGKYGKLFNLSGEGADTGNTNYSEGEGWSDTDTAVPLIDTTGRLGYTFAKKAPFELHEMERHSHTQEAQILSDQPVVLCVAEYRGERPLAEDVEAVIIRPGQVFVLDRDVWHTAAHGLLHDGRTYWMADVFDGEPTFWENIEGGPVYIEI